MRGFRWRGAALALIVLLGALVAGAAATTGSARPDSGAAAVTLEFWQTMNEEETVTLKGIVDRFESSHPNIKINMTYVPFGEAQQKFATAAQAGKAPDVLRAEIAWIADYASQGFLTALDGRVSKRDRADYLKAPFNYGVYAGHVWAIPQVTDAPALLYNKAMFRAKKVSVPETMAGLLRACSKFPSGKGIFLRGDSYFVQPWIWAFGGDLLNVQKRQILIANRASVKGMAEYKTLFAFSPAKCAFRNRDFANDYNNMQTAFKNGQVAMIVNGPWATADLLQGKAFRNPANLGIAPVPRGPGGQGSPVGGHSYVISRNSDNVAQAYTFIQWINQGFNQAELARKNNLLPTRASAYNVPAVKTNRIIQGFLAQMKVARNRPVTPAGGSIYVDFGPNVQKILNGKASPAAGMLAVARAWKAKLFKNYTIVRR
jgi:arabinogalactan oligomer/maltooligosaccharide transport system substrate-binding protein